MSNNKINLNTVNYSNLVIGITNLVEKAKANAYIYLSQAIVKTYWNVGRTIVEFEQKGKSKADYGDELLRKLSKDLIIKFKRGFNKSNLYYMRLFYLTYPNFPNMSGKLTWSHYVELLTISGEAARNFYERQAIKDNWSVRELSRQINSMLYQRVSLNDNKQETLEFATESLEKSEARDIIKDPIVLEFLNVERNKEYSEKHLEQKLIDNLQSFLLELGKGFAFIGRQYRITLDNTHLFVDLVFYHAILKCYVLIDLKKEKANHLDIGQMNMYLNYFKEEVNTDGDNPPIGIILNAAKNQNLVKYALGGISNKMFVSKYQLYLPTAEELSKEITI